MKVISTSLVMIYMLSLAHAWIQPAAPEHDHDSASITVAQDLDACCEIITTDDCGCQGSCGDACACCSERKANACTDETASTDASVPILIPSACGCGPEALLAITLLKYCPQAPHTFRTCDNQMPAPREKAFDMFSWLPPPPEHIPIA